MTCNHKMKYSSGLNPGGSYLDGTCLKCALGARTQICDSQEDMTDKLIESAKVRIIDQLGE